MLGDGLGESWRSANGYIVAPWGLDGVQVLGARGVVIPGTRRVKLVLLRNVRFDRLDDAVRYAHTLPTGSLITHPKRRFRPFSLPELRQMAERRLFLTPMEDKNEC